MKEPGLDGRHRDKKSPESRRNPAEAQRYAEQEFAKTHSSVSAEYDPRQDAGKNRQAQ
jgi:hypothetical protein